MNSKLKQWIILAIISFLLVPAQGLRADITDSINKSFRVAGGGILRIESDLGSIEVTTNNNSEVEVEIIRKVDTNSRDRADEILEDLEIDITQDGNNVNIETTYNRERRSFFGFFRFGRRPLNLKYLISVPEKYNVDLKTAGGNISVDDLEGRVQCKTSGGSLRFGNIYGPVLGRTSGGSITLNDCNGEVDVHTSGGSIKMGEVDGDVEAKTSGGSIRIESARGNVYAKTSGGSITVEEVMGHIEAGTSGGSITAHITRQPRNDCRLTTSGGSVNIYLASDINVHVDARTSGGRVKTDFPVTITGELSKNRLNAEINDGGPELYLRTSGGNINLHEM